MGPIPRKWLVIQIVATLVVFVLGLTTLLRFDKLQHTRNNWLSAVTFSPRNVFRQQRQYLQADDWRDQQVENLTLEQIVKYMEWSNSTSCRLSHDFGGSIVISMGVDGQKAVCLDPTVRPEKASGTWPLVTDNEFSECLVYSFGINNEWTFDEAMQAFGCRVYAFDPSMDLANHNRTRKIHFYSLGLSDRDRIRLYDERDPSKENNWTMKSLDSIYHNLLGHEGKIIDYLKIDIEGDEWAVLPQIVSSGMMNRVRQLGVEIHLLTHHCPHMTSCPPPNVTLHFIRQRVNVIKLLEDYGLVRFDSKFNPWSNNLKLVDGLDWWGYDAYELVWYNPKLARNISH